MLLATPDLLIRYDLTENPTIYVSLIQQFWQTATTCTLDNSEIEITATIDGKVKVVTEASVRRHLKLEDSEGITVFPTTDKLTFQKGKFSPQWRFLIHTLLHCLSPKDTSWEQFGSNISTALICLATNRTFNFFKMIFDGMAKTWIGKRSTIPVESHHIPTGTPSTSPPHLSSPPRISIRQETEVPQPSSPTHTYVADEDASTGVDVRHGGAATTVTSLDAGQGSGNIDKTPSMPHDSLLSRVNTLGSDEVSMTLQELMVLRTTFSQKVESLEADLKQTKKVYGAAYTKLIMKERSMIKEINQDAEVTLVTPTLVSTQGEAHSQKDQPKDQLGVLSAAKVLTDTTRRNVQTYIRRRAVSTGSGGVSTASRMISIAKESVSTAGASMPDSTAGMVYKGKGTMKESESDVTKTKRQQEQERLEERDKYNEVDQAKILVDLIKQRKRYFAEQKAKAKRKKPMTQAQQRTYIMYDFVPMESEDDKAVPKLAEARSSKRDAEEELDQGKSKKQNISESSEPRNKDVDELSQEELQLLM
nr:xylulose kinase-1 [Tanacetum cinerariifolium]